MTLPKEIHDAIIKWAGENSATEEHSFDETRYVALIDGAHHYATQFHTLQQENAVLRKKLKYIGACIEHDMDKAEMIAFINAALTAQPEADKTT